MTHTPRKAVTRKKFPAPQKKERMRPKKDERSHCRVFLLYVLIKNCIFPDVFFPKRGEHFFWAYHFPMERGWSFFFIHANVRFLSSPKASIWCRPHLLQRTRRPLLRSLKNRTEGRDALKFCDGIRFNSFLNISSQGHPKCP